MIEFLVQYFRNLKKAYLEILVVLATLFTVMFDTLRSESYRGLNIVAFSLLTIYIIMVFGSNYKLTKSITDNVNSVFSICLGKTKEVFKDRLRQQVSILKVNKINLKRLFEHFNILDIDWQCHLSEEIIPLKWETEVYRVYDRFFLYAQHLPEKTQFHLFLITPIPIALALGFSIGKYRDWIVYHFFNSDHTQIPSDDKMAAINMPKSSFDYINVTEQKSQGHSNEKTVVLSFIQKSDIEIPKMNNQYIEITSKESVNLNEGSVAAKVVAEIQQVLKDKLRDGKRIHLFPGIPSALAFLIGRYFQEFAPVSVYNPNRETKQWECVFSLDELSKF